MLLYTAGRFKDYKLLNRTINKSWSVPKHPHPRNTAAGTGLNEPPHPRKKGGKQGRGGQHAGGVGRGSQDKSTLAGAGTMTSDNKPSSTGPPSTPPFCRYCDKKKKATDQVIFRCPFLSATTRVHKCSENFKRLNRFCDTCKSNTKLCASPQLHQSV